MWALKKWCVTKVAHCTRKEGHPYIDQVKRGLFKYILDEKWGQFIYLLELKMGDIRPHTSVLYHIKQVTTPYPRPRKYPRFQGLFVSATPLMTPSTVLMEILRTFARTQHQTQ